MITNADRQDGYMAIELMNIVVINDRNRSLFDDFLPEEQKDILDLGVVYDDMAVGGIRLDFRNYAIHILSMEFEKDYERFGIHTALKYVYKLAKDENYPVIILDVCVDDDLDLEKYMRYGFSFIKIGARYSFSLANLKKSNMIKKLLKTSEKSKDIALDEISPLKQKSTPMIKELLGEKRILKNLSTVVISNDKVKSMCIIGKSDAENYNGEGLELMYLYASNGANFELLETMRESLSRICKLYGDETTISCTTTEKSAENLIEGFDIPNINVTDMLYSGNAFLTDFGRLLDLYDEKYV